MAGSAVQINLIERLISFFSERLLNEMKTERSDRLQQKMKNIIEPRIRSIISEYSLPNEMESLIKDAVKEKLEDNEDLTVENLFSIISLNLPDNLVNKIKYSLFVNKLQKKVPMLEDNDNAKLEYLSAHFKPVIYTEGSYIIRQGEPVDMLFFITQGIVLIYEKNEAGHTTQHEKREDGLYGQELIIWAKIPDKKLSDLPISPITIKPYNKVEVFALKAADLQRVLPILTVTCTIL